MVAVAYEDYSNSRRGALCTCTTPDGDDVLACERRGDFTDEPIDHETGSLAIGGLEEDTKVLIAWKQGSPPFVGHVQWFHVEMEDNGNVHTVQVEWGYIAVAVLSSAWITFAYTDVHRNHEAAIVLCAVQDVILNCRGAHVFHKGPVGALALTSLGDDALQPPYTEERIDLVVAYEAGAGAARFGYLQACELIDDGEVKLHCDPRSAIQSLPGPSDGLTLLGLSSTSFALGYADRSYSCPAPSQSRRRALHVCTDADGHPSIGRLRLCQGTFRGVGVDWPHLECGSQATVVDDGYGTMMPHLARASGSDDLLVAAYACAGCEDKGARGLARLCSKVASDPSSSSYSQSLPWELSCGNATALNNFSTRSVAVTALGEGFVVAYDDYGNRSFGNAKYVA